MKPNSKAAAKKTPASKPAARRRRAPELGSESEGARAMDPEELHHAMMMAVASDDDRGLFRLIERHANLWLDSPHSQSAEPMENPALAALLSPHGTRCVEAFDAFFGDVRKWKFGRHGCVHWAVAFRNEHALAWALRPERSDRSYWNRHRDRGLTLLDREESARCEEPGRRGAAGRSALAVAAAMGDAAWLARALELSEESGKSVEDLAREDRSSPVSAIGVALFELAEIARGGGDPERERGVLGCAELLRGRGFPVDGHKATALVIASYAHARPDEKAQNRAMRAAIERAHAIGSGADEDFAPASPFEAAGFELSAEWGKALALCGMADAGGAGFARGARARIARDNQEPSRLNFAWMDMGYGGSRKGAEIAAALRRSPAPPGQDPLGGVEAEILEWAIKRAKATEACGPGEGWPEEDGSSGALREKLTLAMATASVPSGASRGPLRM